MIKTATTAEQGKEEHMHSPSKQFMEIGKNLKTDWGEPLCIVVIKQLLEKME